MDKFELQTLLPAVVTLARQAGHAILPYYKKQKELHVQKKLDKSPVTDADLRANDIIVNGLAILTPDIPVISEELPIASFAERSQWRYCWMVDPLDGTRGFISNRGEFTVNIALIDQHRAVLGVIYEPVMQAMFYAATGVGVFHQEVQEPIRQIKTNNELSLAKIRVVLGRYHNHKRTAAMLDDYPDHQVLTVNSSLKFGLIATGTADFYPRFGPTGEWDTAAGQCIVETAGGIVVDLHGNSLQYNARESIENPSFVGLGDPNYKQEILQLIEKRRKT